MKILRAGVLYFALVFGAGFILGPIRLYFVVPRIGTRMAELMETPIMMAVIFFAAKWVVRRLEIPPYPGMRLGTGFIAFILLLTAEFGFVLWLQGLSISDYIAARDPVSGAVYYISLGIFAIMPMLVEKRRKHTFS